MPSAWGPTILRRPFPLAPPALLLATGFGSAGGEVDSLTRHPAPSTSPLFLPPSFVAPRPYQAPSRDPTLRPRGAAGPFLPPISDPPGPGRHPPPSLPSFLRALLYLFALPLPLRSSTKVLSCDGGFVLFGASMMCHCRLPLFFSLWTLHTSGWIYVSGMKRDE